MALLDQNTREYGTVKAICVSLALKGQMTSPTPPEVNETCFSKIRLVVGAWAQLLETIWCGIHKAMVDFDVKRKKISTITDSNYVIFIELNVSLSKSIQLTEKKILQRCQVGKENRNHRKNSARKSEQT